MESNSLLSIKQASEWASIYTGRSITTSNISYLLQYGRIRKISDNGTTLIDINELVRYYKSYYGKKEIDWTNRLGKDLIWNLSFDYLSEAERTKHVHRLHPYKGKFIPQLVEYFLDKHIDDYKKEIFFEKGDIVLDPFCGSGTTLVQANELGMHALGIDISCFNTLISNVKISKYNLRQLRQEVNKITQELRNYVSSLKSNEFERKLLNQLAVFNNKYFPSPDFKIRVRKGLINEYRYGKEKVVEFEPYYNELVQLYNIKLSETKTTNFLDKWYIGTVKNEIEFVRGLINRIEDNDIRNVITIILSRTIRSCRATTHFDLATLKNPVYSIYYCHKHGKICKPLFSIFGWWLRYSIDTVDRLEQFGRIRTDTNQICITGDSRYIDIIQLLEKQNQNLVDLVRSKRIKGIFTSPPYVGLIDYHDQHAYAYDLFKFERNDDLEIGALAKGSGIEAKKAYVKAIAEVFINCRRLLVDDFNIFIVANDKYNLYPSIIEKSNMQIIDAYKRPVLCRTERDKGAYSETIFHVRAK